MRTKQSTQATVTLAELSDEQLDQVVGGYAGTSYGWGELEDMWWGLINDLASMYNNPDTWGL